MGRGLRFRLQGPLYGHLTSVKWEEGFWEEESPRPRWGGGASPGGGAWGLRSPRCPSRRVAGCTSSVWARPSSQQLPHARGPAQGHLPRPRDHYPCCPPRLEPRAPPTHPGAARAGPSPAEHGGQGGRTELQHREEQHHTQQPLKRRRERRGAGRERPPPPQGRRHPSGPLAGTPAPPARRPAVRGPSPRARAEPPGRVSTCPSFSMRWG